MPRTKQTEHNLTVEVTLEIPLQRVQDLLCCAIEGGIGYWATIVGHEKPPELKVQYMSGETISYLDYPVNEGGAIYISDCVEWEDFENQGKPQGKEPERWKLDLEAIKKGLKVMSTKYPKLCGWFMKENEDAHAGDCFVQCCLFGDEGMRYG